MKMKTFDDRHSKKVKNKKSIPYMHYDNLVGKIESNYKDIGNEINYFFNNIYKKYRKQLESLNYISQDIKVFEKAAFLIDEYLKEIDIFCLKYHISSQSKFRSSFLEEINIYLFKDLVEQYDFQIYNRNIFAGIKINNQMNIDFINKDVDFCIGKEIELIINNKIMYIIIPIICVEVKTYLDSTMLGEIQYSCEQIKNVSPHVKNYVLMENNEVSLKKIKNASYDDNLDEMFVLREGDRFQKKKLSPQALLDYYSDIFIVIKSINSENINYQNNIINTGRLFK